MVLEHREEYPSLWAAIESIAPKIGCVPQTLLEWVKRHESRHAVQREGVTTAEREAHQGARARGQGAAPGQRDPEAGQRVFRPGGARPPPEVLDRFVDQHRDRFGVEPICKVLQIAPSGYWRHAARQRNPALRARPGSSETTRWCPRSSACGQANLQVYGADKVWKQLHREGHPVARCTVERLMRRLGLARCQCVASRCARPIADAKAPCPLDRVNRQFKAERPNQLWVSDFTYVSTWQGFVYVAFVIDVFARRIVGWRVSSSMHTDFVLDALEQALYARKREARRRARPSLATVARSTCPSATPSGWPRPASSLRWAARATATTTRWPRRSTGCTRPS